MARLFFLFFFSFFFIQASNARQRGLTVRDVLHTSTYAPDLFSDSRTTYAPGGAFIIACSTLVRGALPCRWTRRIVHQIKTTPPVHNKYMVRASSHTKAEAAGRGSRPQVYTTKHGVPQTILCR